MMDTSLESFRLQSVFKEIHGGVGEYFKMFTENRIKVYFCAKIEIDA